MYTDSLHGSGAAGSATLRRGPAFIVKGSRIHGKGVFASRIIPAGTRIVEYKGERITVEEATLRHGRDAENPHHTFFFSLDDGRMIDGDAGGNNARWINHACAPNCEAREENGRVFIYALRDIQPGEELGYDYGLIIDGRHTAAIKRDYACRCGAPDCRKTMLAPKRKKSVQT